MLNFRWFTEPVLAGCSKPVNEADVQQLCEAGFQAVVSLEPTSIAVDDALARAGVRRLSFYMDSDEDTPDLPTDVSVVFAFVESCLAQGKAVLIHCSAGVRRTGLIARWLMQAISQEGAGPGVAVVGNRVQSRWDGVLTTTPRDVIRIAHMGCSHAKVLRGEIPTDVVEEWDLRYGRGWRQAKAVQSLAEALTKTIRAFNASGCVLIDTMRRGSEYWAPGRNLSDVAARVAEAVPGAAVEFMRRDELCPPAALLAEFRQRAIDFGEYAERYDGALAPHVATATAMALMATARNMIPVFYCTDPYVPGFSDPRQMGSVAYRSRFWKHGLERVGCHRIVIAESVCRELSVAGASPHVVEIDQLSAAGYHERVWPAASRAR